MLLCMLVATDSSEASDRMLECVNRLGRLGRSFLDEVGASDQEAR